MSGTYTMSATRIRTIARSYTVVVNEIANALLRLADHYGVSHGGLTMRLEKVLNALRVWVGVKQLSAVTLEFLDQDGRLIRKWELPLDYTESDEDDEQYESNLDQLESFLAQDHPAGVVRYRLIMSFNTDHPVAVPGWKPTKFSDDAHLQKRPVASKLVGTKHARAAAFVYIDAPQQTDGEK